jgi:putative endonuclease
MKIHYVYILTNKNKGVLYVGMTNSIRRRIWEHKTKFNPKCFTARYNVDRLVYFEIQNDRFDAVERESQLKAGSRAKKEFLINEKNPEWRDLAGSWYL